MAEVINMPRLSDTMEEGTVAKWLVKKGDKVEEGDIIAEIETDKATMEFESFYEGTVLHIALEEGDTAPVDQLIAIIGEEGEDIDDLLNKGQDDTASSEKEESEAEEESDTKKESDAKEGSDTEEKEDQEIPEGVEVITMPRLSDTMEEGTVANWLKKEGDQVEEGDIIAEIETDKATMEFESFYEGVLLKIVLDEGESVPVDQPIAIIGPKGTDVSQVLKIVQSGKSGEKETKSEQPAKEKTDSSSAAEDSKKEDKKESGDRIFVSPLARKMAADRKIDLSTVKGTGESGRIIKRDIENYKPTAESKEKSAKTAAAVDYQPVGEEHFEEIKNSQMRKTIARRLAESKYSAPHYYLTVEIDMDQAIAARKVINDIPDTRISFNDMVIKASAMALRKYPQVNSQWHDDSTRIAKHIHIGAAVAVEDGLVVPVLKFTDQMTMTQIGASVKEMAEKARNKKLQPAEMEGSTFTVSNLGMFGIQEFTSIINQPNSAILSVGAIEQKPVVKNGEIAIGNRMKLTLACDHRTVDGATGAQFLQTLKLYLENPVTMLA